ncbi:MAG: hypothetical protein VB050_12870 [Geobacteraceae bacterium]|nr:hypothetical protein [Geobacteraceae bacterium]
MLKKAFYILLSAVTIGCITHPSAAGTPVRLRINTTHGIENARGAVADAGLKLDAEVSVTPSSPDNGRSFLPPDRFVSDGEGVGATILSSSFSGWNYLFDFALYTKLAGKGMLHVYAYVPPSVQPANVPPPATFATVNRVGGKTGDGIEFGVPDGYMSGKGGSNSSSGVTAQLAGLMACIKYHHPSWNWFDVKAALRATASNHATGYDPRNYGYGIIDFPAANDLKDTQALPLFPPSAIALPQHGNLLRFFVNSFRQSRRTEDALFKFASPPARQVKELTLAEITTMGGQLIFSGDPPPNSNVFSYRVTANETAFFVWLAKDAQGRFCRIEPYSVIGPVKLSFIVPPIYGPRLKTHE